MFSRGFKGSNSKDLYYNKPSQDDKRDRYSLTFKSFLLDNDIIYFNNNFEIFNNIISS
jgi:hypothetical protein